MVSLDAMGRQKKIGIAPCLAEAGYLPAPDGSRGTHPGGVGDLFAEAAALYAAQAEGKRRCLRQFVGERPRPDWGEPPRRHPPLGLAGRERTALLA